MKTPPPTAALIKDHGLQIQRLEISTPRAAEIAEEVARLNNAVLDAAARADFNDEPARFLALLESYRTKAKR